MKGDEKLEPPKPGQNAWSVHRKVTFLPCSGQCCHDILISDHVVMMMMPMTMIMTVMVLMTLFQELCSNGDLRNHLKSFEFVKTMTQVMQLLKERDWG